MNLLTNKIRLILLLFTAVYSVFFFGCKNELTDEGMSYISSDTLGTLILDSQTDSLHITSSNFVKYINTSASQNMMVGKYGNYESKTLLKFNSLPTWYDTSHVVSATLNFRYNKTYYTDSLGYTSFNVYKILNTYDLTTITYDKFNSSDIGTTVLGTYSGTPTDTIQINIPLDNTTVENWLKYAHDTTYSVPNYGIALVPNNSCTTIKGFCSSNNTISTYVPSVTIALLEPSGGHDTITLYYSDFTSLSYVPQIPSYPGKIVVQNGVSIKDIMHFDISKLPGKVIINQATLEMKVDWANSFSNPGVDKRYIGYMLTTDTLTNDGIIYYSSPKDGDTTNYVVYLTMAFQNWNYGKYGNFGVLLQNIYDYSNLDRYVFYGPDYPDPSMRPRLKIRYSIRR